MIQTIPKTRFIAPHMVRSFDALWAIGRSVLSRVSSRFSPRVKLRSRRGDGNMLWTVLMLALVAGIATISIVAMAPKMKSLGQNAAAKVEAIPAEWP